MLPPNKQIPILAALALAATAGSVRSHAQSNVILPGDPIQASSSNSPGSEGVANAVDGTQAKYLNFDSANDAKTGGFIVSPSVGSTWVTGIALQSANDAPDRDIKTMTLEGSNDASITNYTSGTWTLIATVDNIPSWSDKFPGNDRYQWQTFSFPITNPTCTTGGRLFTPKDRAPAASKWQKFSCWEARCPRTSCRRETPSRFFVEQPWL